MSKSLIDELKRIHTLTYGEKIVNESFLDTVLKTIGLKKDDDPKKADYVSADVEDFYNTLENIKSSVSQQRRGTMEFQKEVETIQIALQLLGYELPRFGVDGLFGPETAMAVEKYKSDNNLNESLISEARLVKLGDTSYSNVKYDTDGTHQDKVNKSLLDDIQKAASNAGLTVTITTVTTGHPSMSTNKPSRHKFNSAVDISIINGIGSGGSSSSETGNPKFRELGNKFVQELINLGYVHNSESGNEKAVIWQSNVGGNHYNHVHVSNKPTSQQTSQQQISGMSIVTPEMVKVMIDKLKEIGVESEDIKSKIDTVSLDDLSDNNVYAKIIEILGAPITEENLKFMYAWRQAEGKGGINNPFNTTWKLPNSTVMNNHGVRNYETIQDGISATVKTLNNKRYKCIVDGLRGDIGAMNIAKCPAMKTWGTGDLVQKVLLGYQQGSSPKIQSLS
jgi:hypothetical protein